MAQFGLHSKRVLVDNKLVEATVVVNNNKIEAVYSGLLSDQAFEVINHENLIIMPGLIDSHVHVNEPGRTEWEGFDSATKSAAAGGITTIVDMPLNSTPVTIDKTSFQLKLNAAKKNLHVNCGFWGGLIPSSHDQLEDLILSGVLGIKIFLTHSGIDDFPNVTKEDIEEAAGILKKHDTLLLAHCEIETPHDSTYLLLKYPDVYSAYLESRPRSWEDSAIALMINLCKQFSIRTHIVHLSSSNSLEQIQKAKDDGLAVTVETCPHYLFFNAEVIPEGSTMHKCAPPIREKLNNSKLWNALESGLIDFVVTDHSPAPPELKAIDTGSFKDAWGGISSLQFSLLAMWTLAHQHGMSVEKLNQLMSENVSRFLKLDGFKGKIKAGYDADLVIWDSEKQSKIKLEDVQHKHKLSPYLNQKLRGEIIQTYVNGMLVWNKGEFKHLNQGKLILKQ